MGDIFISYAREDRERAKVLADALASRGWSVWWDRHMPVGKSFSDQIEQQLAAAKCVVVLWSANSVKARWVQNEAGVGADRGILVPVLLDQSAIPLGFRDLHTANLSDWDGGEATQEFEDVAASIGALLTPGTTPPPPPAQKYEPRWRWQTIVPIAVAAIGVLIAAIALWNRSRDGSQQTDTATATTTGTTTATTTGTTATDTTTTTTTEPAPPPQLPAAARAVGSLRFQNRPICTAFLIKPDVVVTAASCVGDAQALSMRFGTASARSRPHDYDVTEALLLDKRKNVAVLKLRGSPGRAFPPLPHRRRTARVGEEVLVLHYESIDPLKSTLCQVTAVDEENLLYRCVMEAGGSGAPILSSDGNLLVGIHAGRLAGHGPEDQRGIPSSLFFPAIGRWWGVTLAPAPRGD